MNALLQGKKILVTRAKEQAKAYIDQLEAVGADVVHIPLLRFHVHLSETNKHALRSINRYNWIFFTSANGVVYFFEQLNYYQIDHKLLSAVKFAVIGKKTNQTLQQFGYQASFSPSHYQGGAFADEFVAQFGTVEKVMLVVGNRSRLEVKDVLESNEIDIDCLTVYNTVENQENKDRLIELIRSNTIDVYTFASPSTIKAFDNQVRAVQAELNKVKRTRLCVCIGTITEEAAIQSGFQLIRIPEQFTTDEMVKEMIKFFT